MNRPVVPPSADPIELRLLVVAEMLEQAVSEVRRTLEEIKGEAWNAERTEEGS